MDSVLRIIISTALVLAVFTGILTLDVYRRNDLILPRSFVGDINLGGMSKINARTKLKERLAQLLSAPITLSAQNAVTKKTMGEVQTFSLADFGTLFDDNALINSLPTSAKISQLSLIIKGFAGHRYFVDPAISRTQLEQLIYKKFSAVPQAKNAYLKKVTGGLAVTPAEIGLTPDVETLALQLENNIRFFETPALTVKFSENMPSIQTADLEPYLPLLKESFPKIITLTFEKQKWEINFRDHPEWIRFDRQDTAPFSISTAAVPLQGLPYLMYWDPVSFNKFVDEKLATSLDHQPEDVKIYKENDQIKVEGKGVDGSVVDRDSLHISIAKLMNMASENPVEIPMRTVASKLDIAPELQALGITELVVDGYTTYNGSPENRQHNIATGVAKYNGIMIAQGEEFSFDENIGPVDGEHGFLKELVIKPEGTIPEFGGGLCQVSTTLYRAALYAGLPILKRSPHSYAVQYYAQVGGHGLDATVYPPNVDMKFKNDTPGPLIIQAYTEGTSAHFKLYGTKDTRTVNLDGPYISNKQSAPSAPLEVPDAKLKPGQRKQVEKAHGGFDALWYRTIVKDGVETKEAIKSHYKAVPNKFLVGGPVAPPVAGPADVNPFE